MDGAISNGGNALAVVSRTGHIRIVQLEAPPEGGIATSLEHMLCPTRGNLKLMKLENEFEGAVKFNHDDTQLIAVDKNGTMIIVPISRPSASLTVPIRSRTQESARSVSQSAQGPPMLPPLPNHGLLFAQWLDED